MYIWILLATIMVALSFFNISPRADKANAVNEIKAATVLNRFRAEHTAMVKTIGCESVLNIDTKKDPTTGEGGWTSNSENQAVEVTKDEDSTDFGYIKYADNLPIGYDLENSPIDVKHYVACLTGRIEEADVTYENCFHTGRRYIISFMPVPDRWRSKSANNDGVVTPLPTFVNFMTSEGFAGMFYGWTECNGEQCVLHGRSAVYRTSENNAEGERQTKYTAISKDAFIWKESAFRDMCGSPEEPCLFAYTRMTGSDKGSYCRTNYKKWKNSL